MTTKRTLWIKLLIVGVILLLVNIISNRYSFRLDLTEDHRYSLSRATKNILKNLDDPVTITAYFTDDVPVNYKKHRNDFEDILREYNSRSHGKIVYEFIDPNENGEESEREAQQKGIQPVLIQLREKDEMTQKRAYMGAVIQLGEQSDVLAYLPPGAAFEYTLTTSIKKLSVINKPKIGLLQGHGEPSLRAITQARQLMSVMYDVVPLTLNDSTPISAIYKTLVIIAPTDTIPQSHLFHLDGFLANGGRMVIALNRVGADLSRGSGTSINTGLETWLMSKGMMISENFVTDANCGSVMVQQQQGFFVINTPVKLPLFPMITNFADHPITKGLESVVMLFASPIQVNMEDTSKTFTPIAFTSNQSGIQNPSVPIDIMKQWTKQDFNMQRQVVGMIAEGALAGPTHSKIVVFGDGDFVVNGEGERPQTLSKDNVSLLVNAIDWLSDDTGLVELRTKGVSSRPIKQLEEGKRKLIKYGNFFLPLIIIILYGFLRAQIRKNKKLKLATTDWS